jgi:Domain of unknown function (DUF1707)
MNARQMRVSDAERERVAAFLREQALEGRLDHEELEERLGGAYRAKTAGQLEDLIEDLPHRRVAAPVATRRPPARRARPNPLFLVTIAVLGVLVVPTLLASGVAVAMALVVAVVVLVFALSFVFGPFILLGLLIAQAVRRNRRPRHWTPNWH